MERRRTQGCLINVQPHNTRMGIISCKPTWWSISGLHSGPWVVPGWLRSGPFTWSHNYDGTMSVLLWSLQWFGPHALIVIIKILQRTNFERSQRSLSISPPLLTRWVLIQNAWSWRKVTQCFQWFFENNAFERTIIGDFFFSWMFVSCQLFCACQCLLASGKE